MPANNPNFDLLVSKKQRNNFIVSDFLDVENKIPLEKYIEYTDVAQIAGREDLLEYYKDIAISSGRLLIFTLGSKGSMVFFKGASYYQPAIKIQKITDTTGCGDSYLAAFSIEYYKSGNIQKSMERGALAASLVLQHYGGVEE